VEFDDYGEINSGLDL